MTDPNDHIGEELTPELEVEFKTEFGNIRIKRPGYAYTADWKPFRLNIHVDKDNVITGTDNG